MRASAGDVTATAAAKLAGVNRNTANYYYGKIRALIFRESLLEGGRETGGFEADGPYFGARRVRGKRGQGAAGKTPVFGLLKRRGRVFVKTVKNCPKRELMPVIRAKYSKNRRFTPTAGKGTMGLL